MSEAVASAMRNGASEAVLRPLAAEHLPDATGLSTEMGWPYRVEDWQFAHALGTGLALEQAGRLIGTAMRWDYGDSFATVGMIIVGKAHQGRGFGARLFDALLQGAGSRTILLNSTQEGLELYRRRGFALVGELNQHQGVPAIGGAVSETVRAAEAGELSQIIELDARAAGMDRSELLQSLARAGQLTVIEREGASRGYAASRRFGRGYVIGPVVVENVADAQALIDDAIAKLPGEFVRVDTPASSGLGDWLEARGLKRVDTVTSMVRGAPPKVEGDSRIYALCSQSLG